MAQRHAGYDLELDKAMIVAGFGCRPGAPLSDFVSALSDVGHYGVTHIAIPHFRAAEAGVIAAIKQWDLPVAIIDQAGLEQACDRAVTHSALALEHTGVSSVAESAALAAAGPGGRLLATRVSAGLVTCAIAAGAELP
jgi:cobalt-precorrin 5A hydrolase